MTVVPKESASAGPQQQRRGGCGGVQADLFWLYFQPLLPVAAMLWLWAAAVRLFEGRGIRYDACFSARDQACLPPGRGLAQARAKTAEPLARLDHLP